MVVIINTIFQIFTSGSPSTVLPGFSFADLILFVSCWRYCMVLQRLTGGAQSFIPLEKAMDPLHRKCTHTHTHIPEHILQTLHIISRVRGPRMRWIFVTLCLKRGSLKPRLVYHIGGSGPEDLFQILLKRAQCTFPSLFPRNCQFPTRTLGFHHTSVCHHHI